MRVGIDIEGEEVGELRCVRRLSIGSDRLLEKGRISQMPWVAVWSVRLTWISLARGRYKSIWSFGTDGPAPGVEAPLVDIVWWYRLTNELVLALTLKTCRVYNTEDQQRMENLLFGSG
jgi:hypothetical protein